MAEQKAWVLWCWPAEEGPQIKAVCLVEDKAIDGIKLLDAVSDRAWKLTEVPMVGGASDLPSDVRRAPWKEYTGLMQDRVAQLKATEAAVQANDRRIHAGRVDGVRRARDAIEDYQSECALEAGSGGAAWQAKYDALGTALVLLDALVEDWKKTGGPVEGESVAMGDAAADPLAVLGRLADRTAHAGDAMSYLGQKTPHPVVVSTDPAPGHRSCNGTVMMNDGELPPALLAGTPVAPAMETDGKIRLPSEGQYRLPNGCTIHGSYNQEAPIGTLRMLVGGALQVISHGRYSIGFGGTVVHACSPGGVIPAGSRWFGPVYEDAAVNEGRPDASHAKPVMTALDYHAVVFARFMDLQKDYRESFEDPIDALHKARMLLGMQVLSRVISELNGLFDRHIPPA